MRCLMRISVTTYWVKQITRGQVLTEDDPVQSLVGWRTRLWDRIVRQAMPIGVLKRR